MTLEWKGVAGLDKAIANGLQMAADALKDDAVHRSPDDSGELDASATAEVDGREATVGFSSEYAVVQHERTDYRHDDGEAKFLENAAEAFPSQFEQILAEQIKRTIGG